jgi:hypothetical protein
MADFPMSEEAKQRLQALTEHDDGFMIALVAADPHLSQPEHEGLRQALMHRWQHKFELMHVG